MTCLISSSNKRGLLLCGLAACLVVGVWARAWAAMPGLAAKVRLALLPVENLSGVKAPVGEIGEVLAARLAAIGFELLGPEQLADFMKRHRVRYTGGVSEELGRAMLEEEGAEALFITSLETWQETEVPRVSLFARVVKSGPEPLILWIDSVGLTGDDAPGLLALGRIKEPRELLEKAAGRLIESLAGWMAGGRPGQGITYPPRFVFRSAVFVPDQDYRVAVVPFLNLSTRKKAGEIMTLHFISQLSRLPRFTVVEPGLVREELLKIRAVMEAGPSLDIAEHLMDEKSLGADLVLSGKVFEFQGNIGMPQVDFSVEMLEKKSGEVVFSAKSWRGGDDSVYFFDIGRVRSAHDLAKRLAGGALEKIRTKD